MMVKSSRLQRISKLSDNIVFIARFSRREWFRLCKPAKTFFKSSGVPSAVANKVRSATLILNICFQSFQQQI